MKDWVTLGEKGVNGTQHFVQEVSDLLREGLACRHPLHPAKGAEPPAELAVAVETVTSY